MEESKIDRTIKFTFNEDVRKCFKKGEEITFDLSFFHPFYIVGKNGCGKSTLLQKIRGTKDTLIQDNKNRCDGIRPHQVELWSGDTTIDVEGLEWFDHVFCLDSIIDDPVSYENTASAGALVSNGAWQLQKASKGQKSLWLLDNFIKMIGKYVEKYNIDDITNAVKNGQLGKNLIILDEVDEGLDLYGQMCFSNIISKMASMFNAYIICVTHNPICIINDWCSEVYDLSKRQMIKKDEYIEETSGGYKITIERVKKEEDGEK